jgi:multicomponent Na+:H+ antiporter subunit B
VTSRQRLAVFLAGAAGLAAFVLWGLAGLPGFGHYPGPYGDIINRVTVAQTNATAAVSAVNFGYRAFDTLGEEFILFAAAAGVATVLRHLRGERVIRTRRAALDRVAPPASDALRTAALAFTGPAVLLGWFLATHAQTSPSGGFQGGVLLATAFALVFLAGQVLLFRRASPADLTDIAEAVGAGGFAAAGLAALPLSLPYLSNYLPLGGRPGAVSSSGTIALISFLVGIEVGAAFLLILGELMDQALLVREGRR